MGTIQKAQSGGLTAVLAGKYELDPVKFVETIQKTVMPKSSSQEDLISFLMVAKEYDLNPIIKEIHAYPKKGGGIQPVVGVDGWAKIVNRDPAFDGLEFGYENDENGGPVSVTCRIYKKGVERPIEVTEFYDECKRNTDPWRTMPRRMLRHKALIQAGRIAFGISGIMDEDEAETIAVEATVVDEAPAKKSRKRRSEELKKSRKAKPKKDVEATQEATQAAEEPPAQEEAQGSIDDRMALLQNIANEYPDEVKQAFEAAGIDLTLTYPEMLELAAKPDNFAGIKAAIDEMIGGA